MGGIIVKYDTNEEDWKFVATVSQIQSNQRTMQYNGTKLELIDLCADICVVSKFSGRGDEVHILGSAGRKYDYQYRI